MNRRLMVSALVLALSAAPLAACSSGGSGSAAPKIVVWPLGQPSSQEAVVNELAKKFNETYPGGGNVQIEWQGGEGWKQKLTTAMAAHTPPTIFYSSGGQLLQQYVESGGVASLSEALDADPEWKSQYAASNVWDLATFDGKIYGIPAGGPDFELMWQNADVIREAGGTVAPATWDEFESSIDAIKAAGKVPITLAGKDLWPEMIWMQYLTLRFGGRDAFDDVLAGKADGWSNPAILQAATTIQDLVKKGAFEEGFNQVTFASGDADKLLASGQAGYQAMLYFDSANMRTYNPEFATSDAYVPSMFPAAPGGTGDPTDLVGQPAQYFAVSNYATDEEKKEAIAWLKFETTSTEYNIDFLVKNGYTPITAQSQDTMEAVEGGKLLYTLFQMATSGSYMQPYWDQNLPSAVITPMLTAIGQVFDLTITPQEFVDKMNSVMAEQKSS